MNATNQENVSTLTHTHACFAEDSQAQRITMKRLEIRHKNQCDGEIPDGFIIYDRIESNNLVHDFFIHTIFVAKIRGVLSDNIIMLEDTSE